MTQPALAAKSRMSRIRAALGPGLVFALTVNGPASFVSNAAAGAAYGYALIWILGFTVVFRYAWLSVSARYVLLTGESLLDGYRRIGRWLVWVVLGAAVVMRHLSNMYKVVLLGSCVHLLLPLPTAHSARLWSLLSVLLAFAMVFWGGYPLIEKYCKRLVALMTASLLAAAVLARPDPAAILKAVAFPGLPAEKAGLDVLLLVMALIGTEAGSLTNLTYSYLLRAKGWRSIEHLRRQRIDLLSSVVCIFVMGSLVQIAAAASVHPLHLSMRNANDLVRIFTETLGAAGLVIFGAGLWAAAFSGYIGGTTGYALMLTDAVRGRNAGREDARRDPVFRGFVAFWCLSPLYVLVFNWEPVWLVLTLNAAVVVLIPLLALALLRLTNDRRLMGEHTNGWLSNLAMAVLILTAVALSLKGLF